MIYLLAYFMIGMVIAGILLPFAIKPIQEKEENPKVKELIPVIGFLVGLFLVVPLWPMVLTVKITRFVLRKKSGDTDKAAL